MRQFAELFGLSNAIGSYEYLQEGERDEIEGWKQFVHIPDLGAEKAAKRAAKARIAAEKKRLQREGVFLAEIKPPRQKGPGSSILIAWGTDSASNGLVLLGESFGVSSPVDDNSNETEIFTIHPPWNSPLQPAGLKTNASACVFCMSPSAKWLAGGFGSGDWKMRVWDWRRKELSFEVTHTCAVQWVSVSEDEQWVYSLGGEEFIVSSLAEKRPIITVNNVGGGRGAAVHPSGKFAAVGLQNQLGFIDLEHRQLKKKLWVNRRMETIDFFANDSKGVLIRTCLETFLENPKIRANLGINPALHAAILLDPKAVEQLSVAAQQKINSMLEKVRLSSLRSYETQEHLFDLRFSPDGGHLFVATSKGMRVFDWSKLLSADKDAPPPELSVDAPVIEGEQNSTYTYCVRFDQKRNVLLSSCLAGVVQYLNMNDGRSGILLKIPEAVTVWRLELTADRQALCCYCADHPPKGCYKGHRLEVWNYPLLCNAAGLG